MRLSWDIQQFTYLYFRPCFTKYLRRFSENIKLQTEHYFSKKKNKVHHYNTEQIGL